MSQVAALFVEPDGVYAECKGVDLWPESRDARLYDGLAPVVAHPPCERWGRYWHGGPSAKVRRVLGDDGGCFASALENVRRVGGVLEHPEASHAWKRYGINLPPKSGGWISAGFCGGYTCCVEQGHYGHRARKATWLYVYGFEPPILVWGKSSAKVKLDHGFHSAEERRTAKDKPNGVLERLSKRQRLATPRPFRDLLLSMARMSAIADTN